MARRWQRQGPEVAAIVLPALRGAAQYATDKATTYGLNLTRSRIRGAGLGRLAGAVGSTSSKKRGATDADPNAWGAIFARGKTESRGNQALLAYSQGASIFPKGGRKWLAFPTKAIPTRAGRRKMTPYLYMASGLATSIGKLRFVPSKNSKVAFLVALNVTESRRTGRAQGYTGKVPRGADRKKQVIAFILIRFTSRAQRFSEREILQTAADTVPGYAQEYQSRTGG